MADHRSVPSVCTLVCDIFTIIFKLVIFGFIAVAVAIGVSPYAAIPFAISFLFLVFVSVGMSYTRCQRRRREINRIERNRRILSLLIDQAIESTRRTHRGHELGTAPSLQMIRNPSAYENGINTVPNGGSSPDQAESHISVISAPPLSYESNKTNV